MRSACDAVAITKRSAIATQAASSAKASSRTRRDPMHELIDRGPCEGARQHFWHCTRCHTTFSVAPDLRGAELATELSRSPCVPPPIPANASHEPRTAAHAQAARALNALRPERMALLIQHDPEAPLHTSVSAQNLTPGQAIVLCGMAWMRLCESAPPAMREDLERVQETLNAMGQAWLERASWPLR